MAIFFTQIAICAQIVAHGPQFPLKRTPAHVILVQKYIFLTLAVVTVQQCGQIIADHEICIVQFHDILIETSLYTIISVKNLKSLTEDVGYVGHEGNYVLFFGHIVRFWTKYILRDTHVQIRVGIDPAPALFNGRFYRVLNVLGDIQVYLCTFSLKKGLQGLIDEG